MITGIGTSKAGSKHDIRFHDDSLSPITAKSILDNKANVVNMTNGNYNSGTTGGGARDRFDSHDSAFNSTSSESGSMANPHHHTIGSLQTPYVDPSQPNNMIGKLRASGSTGSAYSTHSTHGAGSASPGTPGESLGKRPKLPSRRKSLDLEGAEAENDAAARLFVYNQQHKMKSPSYETSPSPSRPNLPPTDSLTFTKQPTLEEQLQQLKELQQQQQPQQQTQGLDMSSPPSVTMIPNSAPLKISLTVTVNNDSSSSVSSPSKNTINESGSKLISAPSSSARKQHSNAHAAVFAAESATTPSPEPLQRAITESKKKAIQNAFNCDDSHSSSRKHRHSTGSSKRSSPGSSKHSPGDNGNVIERPSSASLSASSTSSGSVSYRHHKDHIVTPESLALSTLATAEQLNRNNNMRQDGKPPWKLTSTDSPNRSSSPVSSSSSATAARQRSQGIAARNSPLRAPSAAESAFEINSGMDPSFPSTPNGSIHPSSSSHNNSNSSVSSDVNTSNDSSSSSTGTGNAHIDAFWDDLTTRQAASVERGCLGFDYFQVPDTILQFFGVSLSSPSSSASSPYSASGASKTSTFSPLSSSSAK
jgi:hypothetical protein